MRILLLNQFYPPDVASTGQFLHDVARVLVRRGHQVEVLCSRRSYDSGGRYPSREEMDGVLVRRLPAFGFGRRGLFRLADYASYFGLVGWSALTSRLRADVVLSLTTPPYLGLVAFLASRFRGSAHAHWVMDVYPEVLVAHGLLREGGYAHRALRGLGRAQARGAAVVLALGPFMSAALTPYSRVARRAEWVPLWGDGDGGAPLPAGGAVRAGRGWSREDLVLMYSGNMGLGHHFEEFLAAADRLGQGGPVWAFAGNGLRRAEVEAFACSHPSARIQLLPYVSRDQVRGSLAAADVHLVSLRAPWQGLIVPSKLQGAFSVGRPVIFVGPRDNEVAAWVEESGGGWVVPAGDVGGLLRAVDEARDAGERTRRGAAALAYARRHFDRAANSERIAELLEEAVAGN